MSHMQPHIADKRNSRKKYSRKLKKKLVCTHNELDMYETDKKGAISVDHWETEN